MPIRMLNNNAHGRSLLPASQQDLAGVGGDSRGTVLTKVVAGFPAHLPERGSMPSLPLHGSVPQWLRVPPLRMVRGAIPVQEPPEQAPVPWLQAEHASDGRDCHAGHQVAPLYVVLGRVPHHVFDPGDVCASVPEDPWHQSVRDGLHHAAQAARRNGTAWARLHRGRMACRSGRDIRRWCDPGRGSRSAPQNPGGRCRRSASAQVGTRARPEPTQRPTTATPRWTWPQLHRGPPPTQGHPEPRAGDPGAICQGPRAAGYSGPGRTVGSRTRTWRSWAFATNRWRSEAITRRPISTCR
jgi:hypothetical protein